MTCSECALEIEDDTPEADTWRYYSDGAGELLPYCPDCARREFELPENRGFKLRRPRAD